MKQIAVLCRANASGLFHRDALHPQRLGSFFFFLFFLASHGEAASRSCDCDVLGPVCQQGGTCRCSATERFARISVSWLKAKPDRSGTATAETNVPTLSSALTKITFHSHALGTRLLSPPPTPTPSSPASKPLAANRARCSFDL